MIVVMIMSMIILMELHYRKGYVPMNKDDAGYIEECERERRLGMRACRCSNCDPQSAARVLRLLPYTKSIDLDELLNSSPTDDEDISILNMSKKKNKRKISADLPLVCKKDDPIRLNPPLIDLAVLLMSHFEDLFLNTYSTSCHMLPETLFNHEDAWQIVKNYPEVGNGVFLREILGGQTLPGMFSMIIECVQIWFQSESFINHQDELAKLQVNKDQETLNVALLEEEYQENIREKLVAKELKAASIAERKKLRLEKAELAQRLKEQKHLIQQKKLDCKNIRVSVIIPRHQLDQVVLNYH